jgi:hypothetical protein
MNDSVDLGIGAVSIPPGTHICAFPPRRPRAKRDHGPLPPRGESCYRPTPVHLGGRPAPLRRKPPARRDQASGQPARTLQCLMSTLPS